MKSKILLLSHFNYSKSGPIHGPVHSICSYLKNKGFFYTYIGYPLYVGEKSLLVSFDGKKETVVKFGTSFKLPLILQYVFEACFTLNFLRKNKQDLVISIDPLNALTAIFSKKLGFVEKVIFYTVDYTPSRFTNKLLNSLYHLIDRFCIRNVDVVWNVSNRIVDKRKEQGVKNDRNLYVPNAPSFNIGQSRSVDKVDRFNMMMVTGVTHSPAFNMVIDAVSSLLDKYPSIKLSLIGNSFYAEELKEKINKSKLKGHVEFLGQLDHEQLLNILPKGGLGLAIYTGDYSWVNYGDSMKAREYLLSGLPVVITDIVSTSEDISKYNAGIVVKPNKKDIQSAIEKLISDYPYWIKSRKGALQLAKDFDMDNILDKALLSSINI